MEQLYPAGRELAGQKSGNCLVVPGDHQCGDEGKGDGQQQHGQTLEPMPHRRHGLGRKPGTPFLQGGFGPLAQAGKRAAAAGQKTLGQVGKKVGSPLQKGEKLPPKVGELIKQPLKLHPHHQPQPPRHRGQRHKAEQCHPKVGHPGGKAQPAVEPPGQGVDQNRQPQPHKKGSKPGQQKTHPRQHRSAQGGVPNDVQQQFQFFVLAHANASFFAKTRKMFSVEIQVYLYKTHKSFSPFSIL